MDAVTRRKTARTLRASAALLAAGNADAYFTKLAKLSEKAAKALDEAVAFASANPPEEVEPERLNILSQNETDEHKLFFEARHTLARAAGDAALATKALRA